MSERAAELASQFERANRDFVEEVERLTDEQWQTLVPGENWTVGVAAHHVVECYGLIAGWVNDLTRGDIAPYDHDSMDATNAERARLHAGCTRAETVERAAREVPEIARYVAGLTDDQLATAGTFNGNPRTADRMIQRVLIGHTEGHLSSIRSALGQRPSG
jgi:uncharacterized damage-inducible protein DinB